MILMICIQLLQERLPYNSVRMYVTMSKGIMGISGSNLLGWSSKCFSMNECFLLPFCWNIVNLKFTATNQCQTIIPVIPIGTIQMLLRFENLCQNSWCMLGQMMTTMIQWWWWHCKWQSRSKKNNHMHIVCPWRNAILLQSSNLIWLELKSILIKRTDSK